MLTNSHINYRKSIDNICDCSLGNMLWKIAATIGIATMNGYSYGFSKWVNQEYFLHELPGCPKVFRPLKMQADLEGMDFTFKGFKFPDDRDLHGEFGSWKYWHHCEGLIRYYFEMKPLVKPYKDKILVHYRDYETAGHKSWAKLGPEYYKKAINRFPRKKVIVITDNIDAAYEATGLKCEYTSNTPAVDFYLLSHADYLVMGNSSFSWWGAILSDCPTVAPKKWFAGCLKDAPTQDMYYPKWEVI